MANDKINTVFCRLINVRYTDRLVTMHISNIATDALKIGERIIDRIDSSAYFVELSEVPVRHMKQKKERGNFMIVKKITPKELSTDCIFCLTHLYHAELSEFIAITDRKGEILFVNKKVSKKDIDGFIEVIGFPYHWVADNETLTGKFLNYVYRKYGFHTYKALLDAHAWQMEQKEKKQAEETAKAIIPLIEKEINSEKPIVEYDEQLISEIRHACYHLNRKILYLMVTYMGFI